MKTSKLLLLLPVLCLGSCGHDRLSQYRMLQKANPDAKIAEVSEHDGMFLVVNSSGDAFVMDFPDDLCETPYVRAQILTGGEVEAPVSSPKPE